MYSLSFCFLFPYPHPLLRLVNSFNLDFIFALDFGCTVSWHLPLCTQKEQPRYFTSLMYKTMVFSLFTFRNSSPSMNLVIDSRTRSAARLLLQNTIESLAQRTKGCPLRASSLSNSFSIMSLRNGLSGPPYGVPSSLACHTPLSMTPLRRYLCRRLIVLPSLMVRLSISMSLMWLTVSKKRSRSRSTTYLQSSLTIFCTSRNAFKHPLLGRKLKLHLENWGSQITVSNWLMACCTMRSTTIDIPNRRILPLSLGISTLQTGFGWQIPSCRERISSSLLAKSQGSNYSHDILSILPHPLFLTTALQASLRLLGLRITSNRSSLSIGTSTMLSAVIHMIVCTPHTNRILSYLFEGSLQQGLMFSAFCLS